MLEMKDRRRRLAKTIAHKENFIKQFDKQYDKIMKKKMVIMQKINSNQLEIYLKSHTKNVVQELTKILINTGANKGILNIIEKKRFKYITRIMKNKKRDYISLKSGKIEV